MTFDPFATAPTDDSTEEYVAQGAEELKDPNTPAGSITVDVTPKIRPVELDGKIVTTFKAGAGFDSPWVVVHASTIEESDALLDEAFANYLKKVKKVAGFFSEGSAPAAPRQPAPQAATTAPNWFPPAPGPGWTYKSGFKKDGSGSYHAWAPPRGSQEKWQFHNPPK